MNPPLIDPQDILAECDNLLARLEILLGTSEPLGLTEGRRMPKITKERAAALPSLAQICEEAGLDRVGFDTTADMRRTHEEACTVRQIVARAELVVARLDGMRRRTDHRCVTYLSTFYAALKLVARSDESVGPRLVPLEARFARGRRGGRGTG